MSLPCRDFSTSTTPAQAELLWPSAITSPINIDKTLLEPDAPDDEFIYWFN
ncbi:MAG: hypothetical protein OXI55_18275 [Gammaproteobacteria bacterium]|nr:hypothetical protein [Gammaproteobacteria bacterium]